MNDEENSTQSTATVVKEDKNFINFFKGLPGDSNLIRLFDRRGYYSIHSQDAVYVAQMHFKSKKSLKYWSTDVPTKQPLKRFKSSSPQTSMDVDAEEKENEEEEGFAILTIRAGIEYETIVRELFEEKKRIEIWVSKGAQGSKGIQWECAKRGSPGNMQHFEEVLSDHTDASVMMALRMGSEDGNRVFGIAFGDATFKAIGMTQFVDDESLSNLGNFLVQKSIKECLLIDDSKNPEYKKLLEKLEESSVPYTTVPRSDFSAKNVEQDLGRLLGSVTNHLADLEKEYAVQSVSCLIKHLELLANEAYFGKFKLERFDLDKYMKLDYATFKGLHILPSKELRGLSLFQHLNKCSTPMGSRLLMQWLKQPLTNSEEIEVRLNFVEAFVQDIELRQSLRSNDLKKIGDLDRLAKRFVGGKANLEDCVNLYGIVQRLPVLLSSLNNYQGNYQEIIKANFIDSLTNIVSDFSQFCAMVEKTVDLDLANEKHQYVIRASFSEELTSIQAKRDKISDKIEKMRSDIAIKIDLDDAKIKTHYTDKDGFLFRVSRKDEVRIRNIPKFQTYPAQKDGVRFSTSDLKLLNEGYLKCTALYMELQEGLVKKALTIASSFSPLIEDLSSLIATLDIFVTMAHISTIAPAPYTRPNIHPMGSVTGTVIREGRHPCVEVQENVSFIPNDIDLIHDTSRFHIITGPNMGGKSTFIRQVGLIVILAQIGCFVPAQSADITIVDCILSRVGAGDSQLRGVSTFMAEMLETSYILKVATKNSLIIIDELGRGTSTYDGFGLAWGIAEYICQKIGAYCLFATHFHELTVLSDIIPQVNNLHVSANTENNSLTLLYKVENGSCDQSFGIHVAVLADFPDQVIETAKSKAKELESFESNSLKQNNNQFLEEFKNTNLNNLSEDQIITIVNNLLLKYQIQ